MPPRGSRRWPIGLSLTLIHLVSIPVSNTSVNPARWFGPALFAGWDSIGQLWVFILAPGRRRTPGGRVALRLFGRDEGSAPLEVAAEG